MKFYYITIYQIRGLTHNTAGGDIQVYAKENEKRSIKAILTNNPDQYCYNIDLDQVLGLSMLAGFVGKPGSGDVKRDIETGIEHIRENRRKELEGSQVIIFICTGDTDIDLSRPSKETDDYIIGLDIVEKAKIASLFSDDINQTLSGLSLATDRTSIEVRHVTGDVYLINESNKPVYSISFSGNAEAYASIRTTEEIIKETQKNIKLISR